MFKVKNNCGDIVQMKKALGSIVCIANLRKM